MGIVDELKQSHVAILEAIDGITSEELAKENTIGKWSARDVILHIAMWDGEALKAFAIWRTGHDVDWSYTQNYLKFNEFWYKNLCKLSVNQVIQMFNLTRTALINDVAMIPDEIWKSRGGIPEWLQGIIIKHGNHHLEKLQAYRQALDK